MKLNWLRNESGQVLVITLFCMAVLLGALGLAVDVGVLFHVRREMQTAADAAAMAGATEMFYNGSGNVSTKAYAAAKANGVDNTAAGNNVIVTTSPTLPGTASACASCVEVQLSTPSPTIFMQTMSKFFFQTTNFSTVNVAAKAIAGSPGDSQTCMYVMKQGPDALHIHGAGDIEAPNCAVYVNSNDPAALCVTGSAGKSHFASADVVGDQSGAGPCKGDPGPPVYTHSAVQTPPVMANLPTDPTTNCTGGVTNVATLTGTVAGPGYGSYACYTNGGGGGGGGKGKKGGGSATPVNLNGATLGPGNYVFESGVTVSGNTVVGTGSGTTTAANGGATIIITGSGAFDSSTATNFTVYAPADKSSAYNGVAIYQPASDTSAMLLQFGSSSSYFIGAVVAPTSDVTLHDQGGAVNATNLIVGTIYVNGKVNLANYSTYNPLTSPFKLITLVM